MHDDSMYTGVWLYMRVRSMTYVHQCSIKIPLATLCNLEARPRLMAATPALAVAAASSAGAAGDEEDMPALVTLAEQ